MVKIGDLLVRSRVTLYFLNGCQTLELGQASTVRMLPSCTRFISIQMAQSLAFRSILIRVRYSILGEH